MTTLRNPARDKTKHRASAAQRSALSARARSSIGPEKSEQLWSIREELPDDTPQRPNYLAATAEWVSAKTVTGTSSRKVWTSNVDEVSRALRESARRAGFHFLSVPHAEAAAVVNSELVALKRELGAIRERVKKLEWILEGVDEPAYKDPNLAWCEENSQKLSAYRNEFVAIDIHRGVIVAHAADQGEFITQLQTLDSPLRKSLFSIHTSSFLGSNDE